MKRLFLIAIFSWHISVLLAQELGKESQKVVSDFIECIKLAKKEDIGKRISFPLDRGYPLARIKNLSEFVSKYDEIFDSILTREIVISKPSDWAEVGYRGIMLLNGDLWLDYKGQIESVKLSAVETRNLEALIGQEKAGLYPSIRNFKQPIYLLETRKYRIRVDDLGNSNYRYTSWPLHSKMSSKPAVIIEKGKFVPDGSGGNHSYRFKQGNYVYECSIIVIGEDNSPPAMLTLYKGGKVIMSENARIISN